ncbi:DUF4249 domain-containing protein [Flavihumibacter fluvii]|uniref:DUF4249 domain-containing protein n=1 Tax=Flavihumibacter fluvii TaxID=2838157 RepID=UPI001BDDFE91|nr:DUF4249 domain-containing protein [Flavihumibacter fluvii]ULQ50736.1 DUF4249 domain-containing protein [Flavihumibacter fluvii]
MRSLFLFLFFLFAIIACRENYESPVKSPVTGYLVVEGVINSGPGATNIRLSRTTTLDNRTIAYETGATVIIEGEDNSTRILAGNPDGLYSASDLYLNNNIKYRLKITTNAAKEYISDYVKVRNNPPIDSISWKRENSGAEVNGVQFYISTHDPLDSTRYYQWEYEETWEYHAVHQSRVKYQVRNLPGDTKEYKAVFRFPPNESVFDSSLYFCWRGNSSSDILIGSSAKLAKDVINLPLLYISPGSEKLSELYSVNVKQVSWSKEGYEFLERMRKNTEQTGSVFDAQPSTLNGNIHCITDPDEPVIGYVSICAVQEKRVFLNSLELKDWNYQPPFCPQDTLINNSDSIKAFGLDFIPTNALPCPSGPCIEITSFLMAKPSCVDCALNGGSTVKPPFWPW